MNTIHEALGPVRRRLRRNRLLRGGAAGLVAGTIAAVVLLLAAYLFPIPQKGLWAAIAFGAVTLLCAVANALRPVKDPEAARAADACGLKQRAETALEVTEGDAAELLREDACRCLGELDTRKIRAGVPVRPLLTALGCAAACTVMLLIPSSHDREAEHRRVLHENLMAKAAAVETAAEEDAAGMDEADRAELRKLTADLKRDLVESRSEEDALIATDRAQKRLEKMQNKTGGDVLEAMRNAGAGELASALEAGDAQAATAALQAMDAESLSALTQNLSGEAKSLLAQAASAAASGNGAAAEQAMGRLSASLGQPGGNMAPKTQYALNGLKGSLGAGGTQSGSGQGPAGSGQSAGTGMGSSGAGVGSSNQEGQAGAAGQRTSGGKGSRDPSYKEGEYETIYDPERAEAAAQDVGTEQHQSGEDAVQIETGPGKGSLSGSVPWNEVVGEYAQTESRAADTENLTREERQWVEAYFTLITEQAGE